MKKQTLNVFTGGLNTDLNPLKTPPNILTESRNIDFITTEGDQLILQKRMGNDPALWDDEGTSTVVKLTPGFIPLAVKELNNIAYIIGYNKETGEGEIGTFPSPDYGEFVYEIGDEIEGVGATIGEEFSPGEPPDFILEPSFTEIVFSGIGVITPFPYTLTNLLPYEEVINLKVTPGPGTVPASVTLPPNGTVTFDYTIYSNTEQVRNDIVITATSDRDPLVFRTATIETLAIADSTALAQRDMKCNSATTGGNVTGSGNWAQYAIDDEDPVVEIAFIFGPDYPNKKIQMHVDLQSPPYTPGNQPIQSYEIISDPYNALTIVGTELVFSKSATVQVRLFGVKTILESQGVPYGKGQLEVVGEIIGSGLKLLWKGDTDPTVSVFGPYNYHEKQPAEIVYQWGPYTGG